MLKSLLLVVLTLFITKSIQNCPDRWALHKVDVWTHHHVGDDKGYHNKSIDLYNLDRHEMIDVIKANVSVLCDGMFKNFPKLKSLTLIEANISKIQPGAFQHLPKLTELSLSLNHLSTIERYQFQTLQNLTILYLSKNQIENVEEDAFLDLIHLRKIHLDRNKLHEIDSKWFLQNNEISLINLAFNNISKLQNGAFTLTKNSIVEIHLENNDIEEIEPNPIASTAGEEEVPYLSLHLDRNKMGNVASDFVKNMDVFHSNLTFDHNVIKCLDPDTLRLLKEVTVELHVDNNPLNCDCLEAATNFVKDHELRAKFYYSTTEECQLAGLKPDQWNQ